MGKPSSAPKTGNYRSAATGEIKSYATGEVVAPTTIRNIVETTQASPKATPQTPKANPQTPGTQYRDVGGVIRTYGAKPAVTPETEGVKGIQDAYQGLQANLDQQLSKLGGQKSLAQQNIDIGAEGSRAGIESGLQTSLAGLDQSVQQVQQEKAKNLRSLANDVTSHLQAAGQYIGDLGAGDSSSVGQAASAIGKQSLRQQGQVIDQSNQQLGAISAQRNQVQNVANQALQQLNREKQTQLNQLSQYFSSVMQDLENKKANAGFQQAKEISAMQLQVREQIKQRLQSLDDEVRKHNQSISDWNLKRVGDLEDYGKQLQMASKYNKPTGTGTTQSAQLAKLIAQNDAMHLSPQESVARAMQALGITDQSPLYIDPKKVYQDPLKWYGNEEPNPTPVPNIVAPAQGFWERLFGSEQQTSPLSGLK